MLNKTLLSIATLVLCATGSQAQPQRYMLDKVVAVVGSSSILNSEVEDYAAQLKAERRERGYTSDRDPVSEALEGLLRQKLLYNQALIDSVDINKSDIAQRVEDGITGMIEEAGSLPALETKQHMAVYSLRRMLEDKITEQAYAQAMQGEVVSKVTIIPGEVERFYKSKDKDSLPIIPEQYVYSQITKFPKSINDAKRRARERLLGMRERVITGQAKFASLARMYSVDPGSAMRGGEMDPTTLASFVQPFADALENLNPGQISEVVETQYGFHIIELIDKKGSLYHCRHILVRPTYTDQELQEPLLTLDSIADLVRKDSMTFERAALLFSDDAASKMNGGLVSNHDALEHYNVSDAKSTVTKFLKDDFGSRGYKRIEDYNAIRQLKVGEVSDSFSTEDMVGNQLSKIIKLNEIIPPHTASLNEDYIRLEQLALNDKQEKVFNAWLSKKIDAMYIYIAPEYRNGDFENKHWVK